jgi:hypothetical protein
MLNKTCQIPWIKYEQLCLFGFNTTLGFQAAHEACQNVNGSLIFVYNHNEWNFMKSIFNDIDTYQNKYLKV